MRTGTVSILCLFSLSDSDFNHFVGNWSVPNLIETVNFFDPFPDKINVMNRTQIFNACLPLFGILFE